MFVLQQSGQTIHFKDTHGEAKCVFILLRKILKKIILEKNYRQKAAGLQKNRRLAGRGQRCFYCLLSRTNRLLSSSDKCYQAKATSTSNSREKRSKKALILKIYGQSTIRVIWSAKNECVCVLSFVERTNVIFLWLVW